MLSTRLSYQLITLLFFMVSGSNVLAASHGERPSGPPPEALEACAELSEGDACSFYTPEGDAIEGMCITPRRGQDDSLLCGMEGGPQGMKKPPKE